MKTRHQQKGTLKKLFVQQAKILDSDLSGKVSIVAGPGSGKTELLIRIYQKLIQSGARVLMLAYNNDAVKSFKERVALLSQTSVQEDSEVHQEIKMEDRQEELVASDKSKMSTIHAFWYSEICQYMLQQKGQELIVLDKTDSEDVPKLAARSNMEAKHYLSQNPKVRYINFDQMIFIAEKEYQRTDGSFRQKLPEFDCILVDQFQDMDIKSFYLLFEHYKTANICVVGDEDQSIYYYSGKVHKNNFGLFAKVFPDLKRYKLLENHRSTSHIVDISNGFIKYNPNRDPEKQLFSQRESQIEPVVRRFETKEEEAREVTKIIKTLRTSGVKMSTIAILCRVHRQMATFKSQLTKNKIQYDDKSRKMMESVSVNIIILMLRVLLNGKDFLAFDRLTKTSGLTQNTVERIREFLKNLRTEMRNFNRVKKVVKRIVDFLGYSIEADPNLEEFMNTLDVNFRRAQAEELDEQIRRIIRKDLIPADNQRLGVDHVKLMTCHSSKGLEFDIVFVVGVTDENFRAYRDPCRQEEETKVLYTAMTRAKNFLMVSSYKEPAHFARSLFRDQDSDLQSESV